jgi:hypothetical protein
VMFAQGFASTPEITALPTWAYDELSIVVDWGTATDVLTGTPVAPITSLDCHVMLNGLTALGDVGDGKELARNLGVAVSSYREYPSAVANATFPIDIPRSADVRAIIVEIEDSATSYEPTNAALNALTLLENNVVRVFSGVNATVLRGDNAKVFGMLNGLPPGMYVVEFAEDKDVTDIYAATRKDSVQLLLDIAAGTYNVRVTTLGIEPPKFVA